MLLLKMRFSWYRPLQKLISLCSSMILDVKISVIGNSIVYIAGHIGRKLTKVLSHHIYRQSLISLPISQLSSTDFPILYSGYKKWRIGASIRQCHQDLHGAVYVISSVGSSDVLCLGKHLTDTGDGIFNHCASLMKCLIQSFYDLRQHHYAKNRTFQLQGASLRHKILK